MDKIEINNLDPTDLPFFARFLEGQMADVPEVESAEVVGGRTSIGGVITKRFPADKPDLGGMTKKYPSDREDMATTLKYPSDGEDHAGGPPITTLKYPSDNEEHASM